VPRFSLSALLLLLQAKQEKLNWKAPKIAAQQQQQHQQQRQQLKLADSISNARKSK